MKGIFSGFILAASMLVLTATAGADPIDGYLGFVTDTADHVLDGTNGDLVNALDLDLINLEFLVGVVPNLPHVGSLVLPNLSTDVIDSFVPALGSKL